MYRLDRNKWGTGRSSNKKGYKIGDKKRKLTNTNKQIQIKTFEADYSEPVVDVEKFKQACLQKTKKWFGIGFQQESCRKKLREIIQDHLKLRFIIIHGPSGIGKTSITKFTLEEMGYTVKSPSIARDTLTPSSIQSFLSALEEESKIHLDSKKASEKQKVALVLDDFETIAEHGLLEDTSSQSILSTIHAFIERDRRMQPLVIIMNDLYGYSNSLKRIIHRCHKIPMKKIQADDIEKILNRKQCKNSKMVSEMVDGDIRKALILDRFQHKKLGEFTECSTEYSIFDKSKFFFKQRYDIHFLARLVEEDTYLQESMIHENYLSNFCKTDVQRDSKYKSILIRNESLKNNHNFREHFSNWRTLDKLDKIARDLSDSDMFKYEQDYKCFTIANSFKIRDKASFKSNNRTFISFQQWSTHSRNYRHSNNMLHKYTQNTRSTTVLDYLPMLKKIGQGLEYPIEGFNGQALTITKSDMDELIDNFNRL